MVEGRGWGRRGREGVGKVIGVGIGRGVGKERRVGKGGGERGKVMRMGEAEGDEE